MWFLNLIIYATSSRLFCQTVQTCPKSHHSTRTNSPRLPGNYPKRAHWNQSLEDLHAFLEEYADRRRVKNVYLCLRNTGAQSLITDPWQLPQAAARWPVSPLFGHLWQISRLL
jgi:hypothetical protein